ncbi:hypothetical protein ACOSP7_018446 [Xanthoceras sorbifolium]
MVYEQSQMVQIKKFDQTCINKCIKTKLLNMSRSGEPLKLFFFFLVYLGISCRTKSKRKELHSRARTQLLPLQWGPPSVNGYAPNMNKPKSSSYIQKKLTLKVRRICPALQTFSNEL